MIRLLFLSLLLAFSTVFAKKLLIGEDAPSFYLRDQEGYSHALKDHRGEYVLLFFYPRDFTSDSISKVKTFEKNYSLLKQNKVTIFGISNDSVEMHRKFYDKTKLTFDLLSDYTEKTITAYGAKFWVFPTSKAYLIGPDGRIFRIYENLTAGQITAKVLSDIT